VEQRSGRTVAFIGLGSMGMRVAIRLVAAGFTVRGYDVRADLEPTLVSGGGRFCTSAAEAAEGAEFAALMVLNADEAEQAAFGAQGLSTALASGAVVLCLSTVSPTQARRLAERAQAGGLRWLDAPVSGTPERAAAGALTLMVGGETTDLADVRGLLDAIAERVFHVGPVGAGSTVKMANQAMGFANLVAASEVMALVRKAGVDPQVVYDVVRTSLGSSAVFEARWPRVLDRSFHSGAALRLVLKDLQIVEEAARALDVPLFTIAHAAQFYRAAAASSPAEADHLEVARLAERLSGLDDA